MKAQEHPFYIEEKSHLDDTYDGTEAQIEALTQTAKMSNEWSSPGAIETKQQFFFGRVDDYKQMLRNPYFGRVDWKRDGEEAEVFYVGLKSFPNLHIYAWADASGQRPTLIGDLFYKRTTERETGTLLLKRSFSIENRSLQTISDDVVHDSLKASYQGKLEQSAFTDTLLVQLLSESRAGRLRDIVSTIQARQFEIISSPQNQSLLIQGVPGSGKTVIALHRVAYLLFNDARLRDQGVLVLGPSQLFLRYTSNVLPILGERQVPQRTFDDWIVKQLDGRIEYETQEDSLEFILSPEKPMAERAMHVRNARNKGSLGMAILLQKYVEYLYQQTIAGHDDLKVILTLRVPGRRTVEPIRISRSHIDIQKFCEQDQFRKLPLNSRREVVELKLTDDILQEVLLQIVQNQRLEQSSAELRSAIAEQVHAYWDGWDNANILLTYRRLFRNPEILRQVGAGVFNSWDLELMTLDAPKATTPFRFSDLAGLLNLKVLLEGTEKLSYGHIVVDEAQDLTPLHFKVLVALSRTGAMTILGDLAQSIYFHQGVGEWTTLQSLVPGIREQYIRESYRATQEITDFANAMLRRTGAPADRLAEAVARPGVPPTLHNCSNLDQLVKLIPTLVRQEPGRQSFAIVTKTLAACIRLADLLRAEGFSDFQLIKSRDDDYHGYTAAIPSYLTKGLEFDVVILADADSATYGADDLSVNLLYVLLTRAVHVLHIAWVGEITPLLDDKQDNISCRSVLDGWREPHLVTIKEYADQRKLDVDWCIERLAATDRLTLLSTGKFDETVLELVVNSGLAASRKVSATFDEESVSQMDPELEQQIRQSVADWEATTDTRIRQALTFAQITFGLLRNQMRNLKVVISADQELSAGDQIIALIRLRWLIDKVGISIPPGQWTTKSQVSKTVDVNRRVIVESLLKLLLQYGMVEESASDATRTRVRFSPDWSRGLLDRSLGSSPQDWEEDVLNSFPVLPGIEQYLNTSEEHHE